MMDDIAAGFVLTNPAVIISNFSEISNTYTLLAYKIKKRASQRLSLMVPQLTLPQEKPNR